MKLTTQRLIIRPYKKSDYKVWKIERLNRFPAKGRFDQGPKTLSECSLARFTKLFKLWKEKAKTDNFYVFAVFLKDTGELIGQMDILTIHRQDRQVANLGYAINNRFYKRGFGSEAASAVLKIGFKTLGFQRLEALIDRGNRASVSLAKAIGMKREGIKRKILFENDRWVDQIVYSVIPEDIGEKSTAPRFGV